MKNSKKQTKKWTRKTKDKRNKKTQKKKTKQNERKERERVRKKVILATHLISLNGFFSHVVYLFLHQFLLSTIRLRY